MSSAPLYITDPNGLPGRLLQARKAARLSQRQLAFPGCSHGYIAWIEMGKRLPSKQVTEELARRLGVSAHWLATGEEDPLFLVIRQVIEEHRSGVEIPDELIDRLDELILPLWWNDWLEWVALSAREKETTPRPKGVPDPVPHWAERYRRVLLAGRRES